MSPIKRRAAAFALAGAAMLSATGCSSLPLPFGGKATPAPAAPMPTLPPQDDAPTATPSRTPRPVRTPSRPATTRTPDRVDQPSQAPKADGNTPKLAKADVEKEIVNKVKTKTGKSFTANCPGDLIGVVGTPMTCSLKGEGADASLSGTARVKVTSVSGRMVFFDIEYKAS